MEYEQMLYKKIVDSEELTENELSELVSEFGKYVDEIEGEKHRWYAETQTIIDVNGQLFAVDWEKGLTENQEHAFYKQPYRVKKVVKTVEVVKYIKEGK